ncbi:MAG: helix-turn-helix domain-containing protein [Propionibacteriaceae bacterium]|nr:helix-turn-helix domain-containing protein [Propionibacteriaceae bacterium]
MNVTAQQAREAQRAAQQARDEAQRHQQRRDMLVALLHRRDGLTYAEIARQVGLTPETVAKIINPQRRGRQPG